MGKQSYLVLMLFFAIAIVAHGNAIPMEGWLEEKQKVTQLQLYFHETLNGPNVTTVQVASAPSTPTSTSPTFGQVGVFDDPMRMGPDPNSEIVGRSQGLYAAASLEEGSVHMTFNFVFTSGEYSGSTLNIVGHNTFLSEYRDLSIVGGTGFFLLARGIVRGRTVSFDNSAGSAIFQYNLTAWHY